MDLSKLKTTLAAILLTVAPLTAQATPLGVGVYDAEDQDWLIGEGVARSIWTSPKMVTGSGVSNLWSFSSAKFDFNGTTAKLTGSAVNAGTAGSALTFDFSLNFNGHTTGSVVPGGYCQFGGGSGGACQAGDTVATTWSYFNLVSGTFTGTSNAMLGLSWNITDHTSGVHPPQAGLEANALNNNNKDGFSMWFNWEKIGSATNSSIYSFNNGSGKGDINTNLKFDPSSTPSPVPLPAAAWLLIGALGALGGLGMRRRKA